MALKVVTMAEMRFGVLLEVERTGLRVTEVCRRYGISRNTGIDVGIWLKGWRAWRTGLMNRDRLQGRFPPKPRFGSLRCGRIIPGGEPVVSELNWTGLVSTRRQCRRSIRFYVVTVWSLHGRPVVPKRINGSKERSPTTCGRSRLAGHQVRQTRWPDRWRSSWRSHRGGRSLIESELGAVIIAWCGHERTPVAPGRLNCGTPFQAWSCQSRRCLMTTVFS